MHWINARAGDVELERRRGRQTVSQTRVSGSTKEQGEPVLSGEATDNYFVANDRTELLSEN